VYEQNSLAQMSGISVDRVTVLSPYIGSGFGGKLFLWPHTVLAAVVAKELKRPVKLSVTRAMMFTTVGSSSGNEAASAAGCRARWKADCGAA
jgi:xanthine dehydrogenase YagR molybdenum-binding subunit